MYSYFDIHLYKANDVFIMQDQVVYLLAFAILSYNEYERQFRFSPLTLLNVIKHIINANIPVRVQNWDRFGSQSDYIAWVSFETPASWPNISCASVERWRKT